MSCVYQGSNISSRHEDDHIVRTARAHVRQPSDTVQQDGSESQTSTVSSHHNSNSLSVLADAVSSVEASSVLPPPLPPPPQVPYIDGFQTPRYDHDVFTIIKWFMPSWEKSRGLQRAQLTQIRSVVVKLSY